MLPALDIAVDEGSRVNMAMLGALTKACGFISPEAVEEAIRGSLGVRYPQLLPANLQAFRRGYEEVRCLQLGQEAELAAGAIGADFMRPGPMLGLRHGTRRRHHSDAGKQHSTKTCPPPAKAFCRSFCGRNALTVRNAI